MYEYESRIGFSQCDADNNLALTSLIDMFQDASTFQSEDLGVGFDYLSERGVAWVLSYWEIDIIKFPKSCDRVLVGTFPNSMKGFMGGRNFCLKDMSGEFLVKANTLWTFLNMAEAKPERIPQNLCDLYVTEEKLDMIYESRKVAIPDGDGVDIKNGDAIVIQKHHLDSNKHVNNGQYVKIAMAAIEEDIDMSTCKRVRVDYRKQARLGDTIVPQIYKTGNKIVVALRDDGEGIYSVTELGFN